MSKHTIRIFSLYGLRAAIENKRAVIVPKSISWNRPRPAAFVIHFPGAVLCRMFDMGMFIYEKGGRDEGTL